MIGYGRQYIDDDDIAEVVSCLKSDYLTQGSRVNDFENALAKSCGSEFTVALNSGTSALHAACKVLGVSSTSTIWTSPISFVASANCARYLQGSVDFVDIEKETGLMSAESLKYKLATSTIKPDLVIPVHYAGQSCEMKEIHKLSNEYGFKILEDASHALGANYLDEKVGSCRYSDAAVFSFHPVKMITTGEGGAVTTNNKNLAEHIRLFRSHDIKQGGEDPWSYSQEGLGFNYRMSDILAALGCSQLKKLSYFLKSRKYIAELYEEYFSGTIIKTLKIHQYGETSRHLFPILLSGDEIRLSVYNKLKEQGIQSQVHYIPIYKQLYYSKITKLTLKNTEDFYSRVLSLPIYVGLKEVDIKRIANIILEVANDQ